MATLNSLLPRMRDNLPALRQLAEMLPKGGLLVEIGSFAGESTRVFLEAGLRVHAIDPWDNDARDRLHEGAKDFNPAHRWHFDMSAVEAAFDELLSEFSGQLTKRKGYDWEFVESYAPGSLDAVYLDSVHTYADTLGAIRRWRPRVSLSGFFCGHDFTEHFAGVRQAVFEEFGEVTTAFGDSSWLVQVA
jgi:hypothetical protein